MQELGLIDLIGLGIVLFVVGEVFIISIILYKKYINNKAKIMLYFTLTFIFLLCANTFLIAEQATYRLFGNLALGGLFAFLALFFMGFVGIFINAIALELTYTDKKIQVLIPVCILVIILLSIVGTLIVLGEPFTYVLEGELFYILPFQILGYLILIPVIFFSPSVFFYFSIVNRENKGLSRRSFWMGLGIAVFGIAFMIEIAPINALISVPMRFSYIFAATVMYICFTMPEWFKKAIQWEEE